MKGACGRRARRRSDVEPILVRATNGTGNPVEPACDVGGTQCFSDNELPGRAAEPCCETATFELSVYPDQPDARHRIVSAPVPRDGRSCESLPPMPSSQVRGVR